MAIAVAGSIYLFLASPISVTFSVFAFWPCVAAVPLPSFPSFCFFHPCALLLGPALFVDRLCGELHAFVQDRFHTGEWSRSERNQTLLRR